MKFGDILRAAAFYLTVPSCVCCGEKLDRGQRALCASCRLSYDMIKTRACSQCAKPMCECTCTAPALETHFVHRLIKVTRYLHRDGRVLPPNRVVYALKDSNRNDVFDFVADEIRTAIEASGISVENAVFTGVPRRKAARRNAGYDQVAVVARRVAKRFGAVYLPVLLSESKRAQKGMHGAERRKNARFRVRFRFRSLSLRGRRVFLLDDSVTTGASLGNAAVLLRSLGAKEIVGVCFAIAYLDPYTPAREREY